MANELHRQLQEKLGDFYEVIFEAEGFQIRRAADRAFIAEYDAQQQRVLAGPHVQFPGREDEDHEKLAAEGRQRMGDRLGEWRDFGFEQLDDGHMVTLKEASPAPAQDEIPRFIVPMAKRTGSVDATVETVEWVRKHRRF